MGFFMATSEKSKIDVNKRIDLLLAQWNKLADQVASIDDGHWKVFAIVSAALTLISTFEIKYYGIQLEYLVIPMTILIVLSYEAYKLRELAILKGYLSKIENTINRLSSEYKMEQQLLSDPMNWFSKYKIYHSSEKNKIKSWISIFIVFAIVVVHIPCFDCLKTLFDSKDSKITAIIYGIYCLVCIISDAFLIYSIKKSERIKHDVYSERYDDLKEKARKAWNNRKV